MTVEEIFEQLEASSNEKTKAHNLKFGAGENQFGVKLGDLRAIAKKIKTNQELGLELWRTANVDAQLLATLIVKPKQLTAEELDEMAHSISFSGVADWLYNYVIKEYPQKESFRQKWMDDDHPMAARMGWSLTSGRVAREPEGLDIPALLDRLENEMATAAPDTQWTMNSALANIGINHPQHRARALAIGEKLGIYRDYPVSKGCTSPFAPIWINEMVSRQK